MDTIGAPYVELRDFVSSQNNLHVYAQKFETKLFERIKSAIADRSFITHTDTKKHDLIIVNVKAENNCPRDPEFRKVKTGQFTHHSATPSPCVTPLPSVETVEIVSPLPEVESVKDSVMINSNAKNIEETKQLLSVASSSEENDSISIHAEEVRFTKKNEKRNLLPDSVELDSLSSAEDTHSLDNGKLVFLNDDVDGNDNFTSFQTFEEASFSVEKPNESSSPKDLGRHEIASSVQTKSLTPLIQEQEKTEKNNLSEEVTAQQKGEDSDCSSGKGESKVISPQEENESDENESGKLLTKEYEMKRHVSANENDLEEAGDGYADNDDADKQSEFRGSLSMDVKEGAWETNIFQQLDIQLGENEWNTKLLDIVGDASKEGWPTEINEISKSEETEADWSTEINEMVENVVKENEWTTSIAEKFEKENRDEFWDTKFSTIAKVQPEDNKWTTTFFSIRKRVANDNEWKTTLNPIAFKDKSSKRDTWKTKIPDRLTKVTKPTDWVTRFNTISKTTEKDSWTYRDNEMSVTSLDRDSHWTTAINETEKKGSEVDPWNTTFNTIEPRGETDQQNWSFAFNEFEKRGNTDLEWNVKFIDIAKVDESENPWSITINDTPDDNRLETDWNSKFNTIEPVLEETNPWDTTFNDITLKGDESLYWKNQFIEMDISDMSRDTWNASFNDILPNENESADWLISVNPIEGVVE